MKEAINQARELEKKMMETTKVTFEQVEEALKEKLATARKEEEEVKGQLCKLHIVFSVVVAFLKKIGRQKDVIC